MNFADIKRLVKLIETSNVGEIEIEDGEERIRISKGSSLDVTHQMTPQMYPAQMFQAPNNPQPQELGLTVPQAMEPASKFIEITSPMVGTFYRAPSPEAPSYVEIGDSVRVGQALCIVEAMKLMNEIESEVSGRVVEILIENGQPVEFGQVMFKLDPIL